MNHKSIPILMYHNIDPTPIGTATRGLNVRPKLFRSQMWLLKKLGYKGLSMTELQPYLTGKKQGKVVGVTFDDGYKNNLIHALPILKKFNHSATCYIVSQKIGGINEWDIEKGIPENPLMSEDEIRKWINGGMEIGAHTQNHIHLSNCDIEVAKKEIQQSQSDLERRFNCPIDHFCYPYGDYNNEIVNMVAKAGYKTATTVRKGRVNNKENLLELPRVAIRNRAIFPIFFIKLGNNLY
ncbi:polysaccharide deacetylase [Bathymodiolus azoricus thioautotrophic gill symbiont]|uniref:Polysaccharide deacetylase n=1 Tax=Bathymodiolus azoricus thioautotrophic gill symbiont TaxID=235205 RepID=A0A1H6M0D8_9GAMM|nr:polysaccharide deacetylase [Bathymodiolus azoricus thioautotrophic gill symbiont]